MRKNERSGGVYAVILVGGKGKRLRPLSTDKCPKAFLSITRDRKSMFRKTVDRIRKLVGSANIVVVANKMHAKLVKRDFPQIKRANLILEPVSRNTAPAVGFAVSVIAGRDRNALIAVLPTDHYIKDEKKQLKTVVTAIDFLREKKDAIIVFGIKPTFPSTEFGYIKILRSPSGKASDVNKADRFVEKPDLGTARKYLKSGMYLWNSGAFIFAAETLLHSMRNSAPDIYRNLKDVKNIGKRYEKMPDISLDYAVMEKAKNMYCIRGSYGWSDVGSFKALKKVLKRESRKFTEEDGKIVRIV
jgi:mannose-1-phosphate guanylyltransferase